MNNNLFSRRFQAKIPNIKNRKKNDPTKKGLGSATVSEKF